MPKSDLEDNEEYALIGVVIGCLLGELVGVLIGLRSASNVGSEMKCNV